MEIFSYKAGKAPFSRLVVKEVKTERVKHCIDTQSLCLGSQVAKMFHGNF